MFKYLLVILFILCVGSSGADNYKATSSGSSEIHAAALHFLKPIFSYLDCEDDGTIEKVDVEDHFFQIFLYVDRDRSLTIAKDEYLNSVAKPAIDIDHLIFQLMDANTNGRVSTTEFRRHTIAAIDAADINKDGEVTEAEVGIESNKWTSGR